MSSNYKNQNIQQWVLEHQADVEEESDKTREVELVANVWHIDDDKKESETIEEDKKEEPKEIEEKPADKPEEKIDTDAMNPLYSGQSERIKQLKKKKIWVVINPIYRIYATVKVRTILFLQEDRSVKKAKVKKESRIAKFFGKIKRLLVKIKDKICNKWKNRKSVIRKRNKAFIASITYSPEKIEAQKNTKFTKDIKFSVIVPLFNTPERYLRDMIESVLNQTYANLELCLGDASDAEHVDEVARICQEYAKKDARVHYEKLEKNAGIAENTNRCIEMAGGDYIALLDHDDMYHVGALFACMERIEKENAEFIYTDEMTFEKDSIQNVATLHFKPDFSMQNLKGVNYICHLCVFKKTLLDKTGMFDDAYNGSQDHDIILKLTSAAKVVSHVPEILYFWRVHPQSVSMNINAKSYAIDAGKAAVRDNEIRKGRKAEVFSSCICATHYRIEYDLQKQEKVSLIIANHEDGIALARLIDSIKKRTVYENYEIVIADMESTDKLTKEYLALAEQEEDIKVVYTKERSVSKAFNQAVEKADGTVLVFLEANMEITKALWLNRIVPYVMQEEIGVMGQRLVDSDGRLQEAGYILGLGEDKIALPIEHNSHYSTLGYMGRMYYVHNVSLVGLFGMAVRKETLCEEGGFDEHYETAYAGFDLCLKELKKGKQVALDPYVINYEYEKPLRMFENKEVLEKDKSYLKTRWEEILAGGDPYYNKNLAKDGSFTYDYK